MEDTDTDFWPIETEWLRMSSLKWWYLSRSLEQFLSTLTNIWVIGFQEEWRNLKDNLKNISTPAFTSKVKPYLIQLSRIIVT